LCDGNDGIIRRGSKRRWRWRRWVRRGLWQIWHRDVNGWNGVTSAALPSSLGTAYRVRAEADGTRLKVWRDDGAGGPFALVFDEASMPNYDGTHVRFLAAEDTEVSFDDIRILADTKQTVYDYTHRSNNELATMMRNGSSTTDYTFDAWGRMAVESLASGHTRTYSWTAANLLAGVDHSDPTKTDVNYTYTPGDLKRVWRFEDGTLQQAYEWDAGFTVLSEAHNDGSGSFPLTKTYVPGLAEIMGDETDLDTLGAPEVRHLTHDHLGSTRGAYGSTGTQLASFEFTPYGMPYAFAGPADLTQLYTGHDYDRVTGQYYAPFRYLSPGTGRWLKQDPLGMIDGPNMYGYVLGNPVNFLDPAGTHLYFRGGVRGMRPHKHDDDRKREPLTPEERLRRGVSFLEAIRKLMEALHLPTFTPPADDIADAAMEIGDKYRDRVNEALDLPDAPPDRPFDDGDLLLPPGIEPDDCE